MDRRDAWPQATLRNLATGQTVTVLHIDGATVQVDNWDTGKSSSQATGTFLAEHEPLRQPSEFPRYAVFELETRLGFARSVRVAMVEEDPAFCDECEPLELHASTESLIALDCYLSGLVTKEAWLSRESRGLGVGSEKPLAGRPGWSVEICSATSNKRYPGRWHMLLVGAVHSESAEDIDEHMELCVRDEQLAQALGSALADGTIFVQRSR